MKAHDLAISLERAEQAVAAHQGLRGTGFWVAVAAARGDATLAQANADRIAAIDRRAFEQNVRRRTSLHAGITALSIGALVGLAVVGLAAASDGSAQVVLLVVAWVMLNLSTHSLTHWIVGTALGIRFTHVFVGHLPDPFPGVKIDYATYLLTPPRARAVMHASGAIVSKVIPFAVLGVALATDAPSSAVWILLMIGIGGVVVDAIGWFVTGDWKKTRRELKAAQSWADID